MQGVHVPIQAPQKYLDMYSHVTDDVRRQYLACTTVRDQRNANGRSSGAVKAKVSMLN